MKSVSTEKLFNEGHVCPLVYKNTNCNTTSSSPAGHKFTEINKKTPQRLKHGRVHGLKKTFFMGFSVFPLSSGKVTWIALVYSFRSNWLFSLQEVFFMFY